jgi:hypothetical protein
MRYSGVLRMGLAAVVCMTTACSLAPPRSTLPSLRGEPSDERPPWLRDLPQPLERHPAPQGWGGDHLAAAATGAEAG